MARKTGITMRVNLPPTRRFVGILGTDELGDVQRYVTEAVARRLPPYLPKESGVLRASMAIVGPTRIRVTTPYARAQFFGVTRHGEPFRYDTSEGPKVGAHWDRRLATDEGRAIAAEVQRYVRKRRRH